MADRKKLESLTAKSAKARKHETEPLSVLNAMTAEARRTRGVSEPPDLAIDRMIGLTSTEGDTLVFVDENAQLMALAAERGRAEETP